MKTPTVYNFSATQNLGDRASSPSLYFDWLRNLPVEMPDKYEEGPAIFGGGGLLHPNTDQVIERAVSSGHPTALWGVGVNYHDTDSVAYPEFLGGAEFVSLRHPENPWYYVPCPSCMAEPLLHALYVDPKFPVVVYEHYGHSIEWGDAPRMMNTEKSLCKAIELIASGNTVVTNSFHGAYWAQLIGRNVALYKPFSNRFLAIQGATIVSGFQELPCKTLPQPKLHESRKLNQAWSEKLRVLFGL